MDYQLPKLSDAKQTLGHLILYLENVLLRLHHVARNNEIELLFIAAVQKLFKVSIITGTGTLLCLNKK
jgi:hypothetical protein